MATVESLNKEIEEHRARKEELRDIWHKASEASAAAERAYYAASMYVELLLDERDKLLKEES